MIEILGRMPKLLGAMVSMGFGLFWGYMALSIGAMAGTPTQVGMGGMGIAAILFGFWSLIGVVVPPAPKVLRTLEQDCSPKADGDFDADAIMADYLKNRRQ